MPIFRCIAFAFIAIFFPVTSYAQTGPKQVSTRPPITIVTDPGWEVSGRQTKFGEYPLPADSYQLDTASYRTLDALSSFLKRHPGLKIEIGGHTNLRPSDSFAAELSANRARAVLRYLTGKGVPPDRLTYKGYGKSQPRVRAVSKEADRTNQRVELKVLGK